MVRGHMQSNRQRKNQNHKCLLWQRRPLLGEMPSALDRARPAHRRPAFRRRTGAGEAGAAGRVGPASWDLARLRKRVISLQGIRLAEVLSGISPSPSSQRSPP